PFSPISRAAPSCSSPAASASSRRNRSRSQPRSARSAFAARASSSRSRSDAGLPAVQLVDKSRRMLRLLAVLSLAFLGACAAHNQIVLLPNEDGSASAITVSNNGGTTLLDQPGSAVEVKRPATAPERITLGDAEIQKTWGDA